MLKFNEERKHNILTQFQGPFCYQRVISYQEKRFFEHSLILAEVFLWEILTNFTHQTPKESEFEVLAFTVLPEPGAPIIHEGETTGGIMERRYH